jgi:hypothetical protein
MPPKHAKMKAHMASMRVKRGMSDSGDLLSPWARLIPLPGPIDRAPIQDGSVLLLIPPDSPPRTGEASFQDLIAPRMTLSFSSSPDNPEFDGELFADASFSDSEPSPDHLPSNLFHSFFPTSGRFGDIMSDQR